MFICTFMPTSLCYEYFLYIPCLPHVCCFRKIPYETSFRVPHTQYSNTWILISKQFVWLTSTEGFWTGWSPLSGTRGKKVVSKEAKSIEILVLYLWICRKLDLLKYLNSDSPIDLAQPKIELKANCNFLTTKFYWVNYILSSVGLWSPHACSCTDLVFLSPDTNDSSLILKTV